MSTPNTPENQLFRINDWLAAHMPDEYHMEKDTATVVIDLLREAARSEDEWRNEMRIVREKLARVHKIGSSWSMATIEAENFISELLENSKER